jgi:hypothetical protein
MTNILAEEAFDTFVEFLNALDVLPLHPVSSIGLPGFWFERTNVLIDFVIPGDIGDEVSYVGEAPNGFNLNGFIHQKNT